MLDQLGTLAADGRHQELTVTGWATVAESAARRVQKKQEKAVSRLHWPGGVSPIYCSEQACEVV